MTRMTRPDCAVMCNLINTHTHTHTRHRMTRMTGPDCAVMCNLINTHTHTHHSKRKRQWYKNTRKKRHLQINKRKKERKNYVWLSGRLHIEGRLNEGPRLDESIKTKTKQNKTNVKPEKDAMTSANQTTGGYKFAPLVFSQQGRANQDEPACIGLPSSWSFVSRSGIHTTACRSPALAFSSAIHFLMKCSAPCSAVLGHFPSSWAAAVHWSALMPKALRSSRKHPIQSFSWPPTQPAPPTISPNISHFGSLVSFMRATNPANKIRLLRKVASMPSLPFLISVSR